MSNKRKHQTSEETESQQKQMQMCKAEILLQLERHLKRQETSAKKNGLRDQFITYLLRGFTEGIREMIANGDNNRHRKYFTSLIFERSEDMEKFVDDHWCPPPGQIEKKDIFVNEPKKKKRAKLPAPGDKKKQATQSQPTEPPKQADKDATQSQSAASSKQEEEKDDGDEAENDVERDAKEVLDSCDKKVSKMMKAIEIVRNNANAMNVAGTLKEVEEIAKRLCEPCTENSEAQAPSYETELSDEETVHHAEQIAFTKVGLETVTTALVNAQNALRKAIEYQEKKVPEDHVIYIQTLEREHKQQSLPEDIDNMIKEEIRLREVYLKEIEKIRKEIKTYKKTIDKMNSEQSYIGGNMHKLGTFHDERKRKAYDIVEKIRPVTEDGTTEEDFMKNFLTLKETIDDQRQQFATILFGHAQGHIQEVVHKLVHFQMADPEYKKYCKRKHKNMADTKNDFKDDYTRDNIWTSMRGLDLMDAFLPDLNYFFEYKTIFECFACIRNYFSHPKVEDRNKLDKELTQFYDKQEPPESSELDLREARNIMHKAQEHIKTTPGFNLKGTGCLKKKS